MSDTASKKVHELIQGGRRTLATINSYERAALNGVQKLLPHWAKTKRAYQEIVKALAPLVGCDEKHADRLIKGNLN